MSGGGAISAAGRFWPERLSSARRGEAEGRSSVGSGKTAGVARFWSGGVPEEDVEGG